MYSKFLKFFISLFFIKTSTLLIVCGQSPGGVSSQNTLWLKANEGITLNNQLVEEWQDYSGANVTGNFEVISPGAGGITQTAPSYNESGINFNPYVVFNSNQTNSLSSEHVFPGNLLFSHSHMTLFQVINLKTTSGTGVWVKWQTSNTTNNRLGNEVNNGGMNSGRQRFDLRGVNLYTTQSVTNADQLITNYTRPGSLGVRLQGGVNNTINSSANPSNTQSARLTIGNENISGGDPYPTTVDIAEMIIYNRELTFEEMNKVESYLAIKYGFTLVQTGSDAVDYVASNNQVIWNNASNSPYLHRITGIGRDDASSLYQKQSRSIHQDPMITLLAGNMTQTMTPLTNQLNQQMIHENLNFVLIADNNESTEFNQCVEFGGAVRMERVWKTQKTGQQETVTIGVDANSDPMITHLLISDDEHFNQGLTFVPFTTLGDYKLAEYDLSKGQYFTLSFAPISLNEEIKHLVCEGDKGRIEINPTGGLAPYDFLWEHDQSTLPLIEDLSAGSYTVTVTYGFGCSYTETLVVENNFIDWSFETNVETAYCERSNGSISVSTHGGRAPFTYQLDGNIPQESSIFNNLSSGNYTIVVTDDNNCSFEEEIVIPNTNYDLILEAESSPAFCDLNGIGGKMNVKVSNPTHPPFKYFWDDFPNINQSSIHNIGAGEYKITVTDEKGCKGTETIRVEEIECCFVYFPTAFSPNGDGVNDLFGAVFNESMITFQMNIYNRWGQLVYTTSKPGQQWNGYFNEIEAPIGVYYYYGHYKCLASDEEFPFKGEFTLVR